MALIKNPWVATAVAFGVTWFVVRYAVGQSLGGGANRYTSKSNIGRFTTTGTPSQYAGFFGAGSSTLEEEVIPMAGFFGAGSSKLEEPPLPGSYNNARPSAGFLSMSSPIQEDFYGPDSYVPWEQRG